MPSFKNQREMLVERLIMQGILKSPRVIRSMKIVPREEFVPKNLREHAYVDSPLPIGSGQTISAPHMCAMMNELLQLEVGHNVLEVGAGSGYHAALVAEIVAPSDEDPKKWGHVYTTEIIPELVEFAQKNLERTGYSKRVTVILTDGSKGYPEKAPYDRMLVTAAAPDVPQPLIEQLKSGGILVIPVGVPLLSQDLLLVEKLANGKIKERSVCPVAFVPLKGLYGFP